MEDYYNHMEAMLGTWTLMEKAKTTNSTLKAFTIAHIMKSPSRGNTCELEGCNILEGNICSLSPCGRCKNCVPISNTTVHGSDLAVFFNIGIDVGGKGLTTNGWIGPYSTIVTPTVENSTSSFQLRYIHTPDTEYLHGNGGASLYAHDFEGMMGQVALQNTIDYWQTTKNSTDDSSDDARPLLPFLQFDFTKKSSRSKRERLTPHVSNACLLSKNETESLGLDGWEAPTFSGPYPYKNESVWMLDMAGATVKGCVDGLPCLPPAAQGIKPHVTISSPDPNFDVSVVTLTIACFVLGLFLLISLAHNILTCRKSNEEVVTESSATPPPPPYEPPSNSLEEPLLAPPPQEEEAADGSA